MKKSVLQNKEFVFIDFDGTIKESDKVKANAFIKIFKKKIDINKKKKILDHHYNNLGISRDVKIPLYLKFVGIKETQKNIKKYKKLFSKITIENVCNSKWITGAKKFIFSNKSKKLILITATPKTEIKIILKKLNISNYFYKIYGSPIIKSEEVKNFIVSNDSNRNKYVYIGNSMSDFEAANKNKIIYINIGKLKNCKKKYIYLKNFKLLNH